MQVVIHREIFDISTCMEKRGWANSASYSATTAANTVTDGRAEKIKRSKRKGTFSSIKAKRSNRLSDLQRSKYLLTYIKSIYVIFNDVITFLSIFRKSW